MCTRTLCNDYDSAAHALANRKSKAAAKKKLAETEGATADAIRNEIHNQTDVVWDVPKAYQGAKGELKLKQELEDTFARILSDKESPSMSSKYNLLKTHVENNSGGSLSGFGYVVFNNWMLGRRKGNRVKAKNRAAMISFIKANPLEVGAA